MGHEFVEMIELLKMRPMTAFRDHVDESLGS
jgi:hypothetical protein